MWYENIEAILILEASRKCMHLQELLDLRACDSYWHFIGTVFS
jgi:hypothetical protein